MLSAESEPDLEDWMDKLTRVIHADKAQDDARSERGIIFYILTKIEINVTFCQVSLLHRVIMELLED